MSKKECPLNRDYLCDDRCAWDYNGECGLLFSIDNINDILLEIRDGVLYKND